MTWGNRLLDLWSSPFADAVGPKTGTEQVEHIDGVGRGGVGLLFDHMPPMPDLLQRQATRRRPLIAGAEIQGTAPMWNWIGDEPATTFSY